MNSQDPGQHRRLPGSGYEALAEGNWLGALQQLGDGLELPHRLGEQGLD